MQPARWFSPSPARNRTALTLMVVVTIVCAFAWVAMETVDDDGSDSLGAGIWWYLGALFVLGACLPWLGQGSRWPLVGGGDLAPSTGRAGPRGKRSGRVDQWSNLPTGRYHLPAQLRPMGSRSRARNGPGARWPLLPFAVLPLLQIPIMLALLPLHFINWPGDWTVVPGLGLVVLIGYFGLFVGWAVGLLVLGPLVLLVRWSLPGRRRWLGWRSPEAKQAPMVAGLVLGILLMAVGMVLAVQPDDDSGSSRAGMGDQFRALIFLPFNTSGHVVASGWLWTARIGVVLIVGSLLALVRFRKRYPWLR